MGPEEFSRTYLPLRDAAYRVALHLLESSDDAMDAVQDLYIRLWERRDALDAVRNPGAYCITLVRNICIDRIRSAAKIDRKAEVGECGASYPPPDERLQARQQLAGVLDRMASLPEKERKILHMRIFEALDYREISRRIIDFLSGVAYANNGNIRNVAKNTFIIVPTDVDVMGELIPEDFDESGNLYF